MPPHSAPRPTGRTFDGDDAPSSNDVVASGGTSRLLDPVVLEEMELDFSDTGVVAQFARDFSSSLGEKIDRLERRLRSGDAPGVDDAVISLSTSSDMIGAERLGNAARAARAFFDGTDAEAALDRVEELRRCAAETLRELDRAYPQAV